MQLTKKDVRLSLGRAKVAFPHFAIWEFSNVADTEHSGFTLWGEFVPDRKEPMPRHFFVTFEAHESSWSGHLTIGQHAYFWSSADFGDAYLLSTDACATLEDAIGALKKEIADLFAAVLNAGPS